jgi:tRNA (cytidine56-2'-O)-methyltransferase
MEKRLWNQLIETLPTREECIEFLKKSNCEKNVITHCLAVEQMAVKIAILAMADKELVSRGALLHDIGRGKIHGISHAALGADIARELGLSVEISNIIERHIGAGITKSEAEKLGLPIRNYIPKTLEEKIVAHADNLISHDKKRKVAEIIQYIEELGYKEQAQKIRKLHEELSKICQMDLDLIEI